MRARIQRCSRVVVVLALSGSAFVYGSSVQASATSSDRLIRAPDPAVTPGTANPDVTPITLNSTICAPNATQPRSTTSASTTTKVFARYRIPSVRQSDYVIDQLVPLELGGTNDVENLWPEPKVGATGAARKDAVERLLYQRVCDGTIEVEAAQQWFETDWTRIRSLVPFADKYLEFAAPVNRLGNDLGAMAVQLSTATGAQVATAAGPLADAIERFDGQLAQVAWPDNARGPISNLIHANEATVRTLRGPATQPDFVFDTWIQQILADQTNAAAAVSATRTALGLTPAA